MYIVFTKQLGSSSSNNIATTQAPGSSALTLNGSAVTAGVATIDTKTNSNISIGRRVGILSSGNDTGITWTVSGTNIAGMPIADTFAGAGTGATAQSNLDFVTVTSIIPSGAVAANATAGTTSVGSSPWVSTNWRGFGPLNIGLAVEVVTGSVNFTVEHTYDDPNSLLAGATFPLPFSHPVIQGAAATVDGTYTTPITALRVTINTGTGEIRMRIVEAGTG